MATPVPAVERAGRIVALLSTGPRRRWTVSQVSAELGLAKATCFAILTCLTELGWIRRDSSAKSYCLGPEFVRLGWATLEQVHGLAVARREMFALARELAVGCFVCALVDDEMVILDVAGGEDESLALPSLDARPVPARPPLGSVYFAWSSPDEIDAWLRRSGGARTVRELEVNRRALRAIRARGYSVGGGVEVQLQVEELLDRIGTSRGDERIELAITLADLVRGTPAGESPGTVPHPVTHLIAPAFDAAGRISLTLTVVGRAGQVHDANVTEYAAPLLAGLGRVTTLIGGRVPDAGLLSA
jgi:DNA-binding IclR family transcriptional regulator